MKVRTKKWKKVTRLGTIDDEGDLIINGSYIILAWYEAVCNRTVKITYKKKWKAWVFKNSSGIWALPKVLIKNRYLKAMEKVEQKETR